MTQEAKHASGGRAPRRQVVYAGRKVPGLFERKTRDGRVVFELRKNTGGHGVRCTLTATTATDAIREQRSVLAKLDAGTRLVGRSDISLGELRDAWVEWARSPESPLAARTVELYSQRLDDYVLKVLGRETKAASLTATHLRTVIDRLRARSLAGSTVRGCVTATSALLRFGVRRGHLETNPVRLLERGDRPSAKRQKEPRYLDRSEIDRLLARLRPEPRAVAATLAFAGLRISEALALRWQDVDFEAEELHVPGTKTEASRATVPMIGLLVAELKRHRSLQSSLARLRSDALVFQTSNQRPLDRKDVLRSIYAAGDAAGLNPKGAKKVGCHDLRHSCAGLLLAAGVPAPRTAAVMRHANTRTLLIVYAGLVESQQSQLRDDLEIAFQ